MGLIPPSYKVSCQKFPHLQTVDSLHAVSLAYGLTEMSAASHLTPMDQFLTKAGSVGVLLPNLEARLVGSSGVDVKAGGNGELWLRGPTVMKVNSRVQLATDSV